MHSSRPPVASAAASNDPAPALASGPIHHAVSGRSRPHGREVLGSVEEKQLLVRGQSRGDAIDAVEHAGVLEHLPGA